MCGAPGVKGKGQLGKGFNTYVGYVAAAAVDGLVWCHSVLNCFPSLMWNMIYLSHTCDFLPPQERLCLRVSIPRAGDKVGGAIS